MELTTRRRFGAIARLLAPLSAVLTGLLAGGMGFIEIVLLPFWRGSSPAEFRQWFTTHSDRIRSVMIPLGVGAGAVSTAYALTQVADRRPNMAATTAAATTLGAIAITVTVNEPANHRFAGGELTDAETRNLLDKWARWHHLRVALGMIATTAAAVASHRRQVSLDEK
jgi:anthrone oxygenase-like protein